MEGNGRGWSFLRTVLGLVLLLVLLLSLFTLKQILELEADTGSKVVYRSAFLNPNRKGNNGSDSLEDVFVRTNLAEGVDGAAAPLDGEGGSSGLSPDSMRKKTRGEQDAWFSDLFVEEDEARGGGSSRTPDERNRSKDRAREKARLEMEKTRLRRHLSGDRELPALELAFLGLGGQSSWSPLRTFSMLNSVLTHRTCPLRFHVMTDAKTLSTFVDYFKTIHAARPSTDPPFEVNFYDIRSAMEARCSIHYASIPPAFRFRACLQHILSNTSMVLLVDNRRTLFFDDVCKLWQEVQMEFLPHHSIGLLEFPHELFPEPFNSEEATAASGESPVVEKSKPTEGLGANATSSSGRAVRLNRFNSSTPSATGKRSLSHRAPADEEAVAKEEEEEALRAAAAKRKEEEEEKQRQRRIQSQLQGWGGVVVLNLENLRQMEWDRWWKEAVQDAATLDILESSWLFPHRWNPAIYKALSPKWSGRRITPYGSEEWWSVGDLQYLREIGTSEGQIDYFSELFLHLRPEQQKIRAMAGKLFEWAALKLWFIPETAPDSDSVKK